MQNGKWGDPEFPHSGWEYVDKKDLGPDNFETCEICEVQPIRYKHKLIHADYPSGFWAGCECTQHLLDEVASKAVRMSDAHMREIAKVRAERSIEVLGKHYLTSPIPALFPQWSPLAVIGGNTMEFTVLPFIKPARIYFEETHSGGWVISPKGVESAVLVPIANYPIDPKSGRPLSWRNEFGALLLRDEDREAIKSLTSDKAADYRIRLEKGHNKITFIEVGAADWQDSSGWLQSRAEQFSYERSWLLPKLMFYTHEEEAGQLVGDVSWM